MFDTAQAADIAYCEAARIIELSWAHAIANGRGRSITKIFKAEVIRRSELEVWCLKLLAAAKRLIANGI
jgi:hypothetical protein